MKRKFSFILSFLLFSSQPSYFCHAWVPKLGGSTEKKCRKNFCEILYYIFEPALKFREKSFFLPMGKILSERSGNSKFEKYDTGILELIECNNGMFDVVFDSIFYSFSPYEMEIMGVDPSDPRSKYTLRVLTFIIVYMLIFIQDIKNFFNKYYPSFIFNDSNFIYFKPVFGIIKSLEELQRQEEDTFSDNEIWYSRKFYFNIFEASNYLIHNTNLGELCDNLRNYVLGFYNSLYNFFDKKILSMDFDVVDFEQIGYIFSDKYKKSILNNWTGGSAIVMKKDLLLTKSIFRKNYDAISRREIQDNQDNMAIETKFYEYKKIMKMSFGPLIKGMNDLIYLNEKFKEASVKYMEKISEANSNKKHLAPDDVRIGRCCIELNLNLEKLLSYLDSFQNNNKTNFIKCVNGKCGGFVFDLAMRSIEIVRLVMLIEKKINELFGVQFYDPTIDYPDAPITLSSFISKTLVNIRLMPILKTIRSETYCKQLDKYQLYPNIFVDSFRDLSNDFMKKICEFKTSFHPEITHQTPMLTYQKTETENS